MVFLYSEAYVAMYLGDWKSILILFIQLLFHKHNTVEKLRLISIYALDLWAAYGLHNQRLLNPICLSGCWYLLFSNSTSMYIYIYIYIWTEVYTIGVCIRPHLFRLQDPCDLYLDIPGGYVVSLAMWHWQNFPGASEVTMKDVDKCP